MLEAALDYASRGWAVLPLRPGTKVPATSHGVKDATTDEQQIRQWWTEQPNCNIGIATGLRSGLIVIDIDPRNGGEEAWSAYLRSSAWGNEGDVPRVRTPASGSHYYFRYSEGTFQRTMGVGVDVQGNEKYVVSPPSVIDGVAYEWVDDNRTPSPLPESLLERIKKPEYKPKQVVLGDSNFTDDRPGSIFNRTATWDEILTPHGWEPLYEEDGETYWRRPGKSSGVHSASTNYGGSDLLYVFSSAAAPLEADTAYSKFSAYTILNHGGDYRSSVKALATRNIAVQAAPVEQKEYSFEEAFGSGHFIGQYIGYASLQTDAPSEYHEAAGLSLTALVSPSCRGSLAPYPGGLSTNLYAVLVGGTTRSRKSTAQRIANSLAKVVSPYSVLPNRATTEALIEAMSARGGFATLWTPDEFGVQLAEIYSRSHLQGLEEMLLTLYAGDDYTYQRTKKNQFDTGQIVVRNPHMNILAAATPESLMRAGSTALESGLLPRFAVVYPKVLPEPRPAGQVDPHLDEMREALLSRLRGIQQWAKGITHISFSTGSLALLNAAESILVRYGNHTARLPTMLFKVAMLSAIADLRTEVTEQDAEAAVKVVMRWADGVNNLRPMLSMRSVDVDFERSVQTAKEVFNRYKQSGTVPRSVVARELRLSEDAFARVERTLVGRAEIESASGYWYIKE